MMKRLLLIVLLGCLGVVFYQSVQAMGGGWVIDNGSVSQINQVCRDGYRMTHAKLPGNIEPTNGNRPVRFGIDVDNDWFNDNNTITVGAHDYHLFGEYYGRVGPVLDLQTYATKIDEPIDTLIGEMEHYYVGTYPFSRPLPVGFHVAFTKANVYDIWMVEDCYLLTLDGNTDQTIDVNKFINPGYFQLDSADVMVVVENVPENSELMLGEQQLEAGTLFRLGSAELTGLNYVAGDNPPLTDSFTYNVRATYRVSVDEDGRQITTGASTDPSISANATKFTFTTEGTDLMADVTDSNNEEDVYFRQYEFGEWTTKLVSHTESDQNSTANGRSYNSDVSPDGRMATYVSAASDIEGGSVGCFSLDDENGARDIFKWNSDSTTNRRVSIFNFDNPTPSLQCVEIDARSLSPTIADASLGHGDEKVAFQTLGDFPNLVFSTDNSASDILLFDNGITSRLYVANDAFTLTAPDARSYAADISSDGKFVAFTSDASNLFSSDTNGHADVGVKDLSGGVTRVSVASDGSEAVGGDSTHPAISQLGRHIAFESRATNLSSAEYDTNSQIYVHDTDTGCTQLLTKSALSLLPEGEMANGASSSAKISADGRFVAFESIASDLVADDENGVSDIFVVDRDYDQNHSFYAEEGSCDLGPIKVYRASIAGDGTEANGGSFDPSLSANGDFIAFSSDATNLISGDTNGLRDVFVHYIGYTGEIRFETQEIIVDPICALGSCAYIPIVR